MNGSPITKLINISLAGFLLSLLILPFSEVMVILPLGVVMYFIISKTGKQALVYIAILGFLLVTSEWNDLFRKIAIFGGTAVLSYLAFFKSFYQKRKLKPVPKDITAFAVFVLVTSAISSILSINPAMGFNAVIKQAFFYYLVFLIYQISYDYDSMKMLSAITFITALAVTAGTLVMFLSLGWGAILSADAGLRTSGVYENINAAGSIVALGTVVLLGYLFTFGSKAEKKYKYLSYFILLLFTAALLITNSRASFLLVGFTVIMFVIIFKKHLVKYGVAGFLLLAFILAISPQLDEIIEVYLRLDRIMNIRDILWRMSFDAIADNPVWGIGPDVFKEYFYKYLPVMMGSYPESKVRYLYEVAGTSGLSHNFLLYRFTELGIPGLISALWLPFLYFRYGLTAYDVTKERDPQKAKFILVLFLMGIGIFLRSAFESIGIMTYGWIMLDLPFWCFFVILVNYSQHDYSPAYTVKEAPSENESHSRSSANH